ncbi:MAG: hypothetical protein D6803_06555 [Anaerolineae bacterium]|nr:MAG: hypothetical protein D6803_06555 [Anaerolineae bacterium]
MKPGWMAAISVLIGLLAAGLLELASRPPRGSAIQLLPPPTPAPLKVHIAGAVQHPGVVALPPGSRVEDAIQAAGGLTEPADVTALNLAAQVQDGEKIIVPMRAATTSPPVDAQPVSATVEPTTAKININTASQQQLEALPGIGPTIAARIIAYRNEHGPFQTIEQIMDVQGIGTVTFDKIKAYIAVEER